MFVKKYKYKMSTSTTKEWVDYCTSVKEGDDNYNSMQKVVRNTGCAN